MIQRIAVTMGLIAMWIAGGVPNAHAGSAKNSLGIYLTQSKGDVTSGDVAKALEGLGSNDRLRVESSQTGRVEGYYGGIEGSSLILKDSKGTTSIPLSSTEGVWLGHTEKKTGAIALGIVGAVLGATIANRNGGMSDGNVIAGFAAGGLLGSLVGLALGSLVTGWDELFPGSGTPTEPVAAFAN